MTGFCPIASAFLISASTRSISGLVRLKRTIVKPGVGVRVGEGVGVKVRVGVGVRVGEGVMVGDDVNVGEGVNVNVIVVVVVPKRNVTGCRLQAHVARKSRRITGCKNLFFKRGSSSWL